VRHTCAIKENSILRIKKVDIYTSVHGIKTMFGSSFPPVVCKREITVNEHQTIYRSCTLLYLSLHENTGCSSPILCFRMPLCFTLSKFNILMSALY
jgi:hypothetical protein